MIPKAPKHNRMKPKLGKMNADDREYAAWVTRYGCEVCGCQANAHHEPYKSQGGTHKDLVALCRLHHQDNVHGRHGMSLERFNETYGLDVRQMAIDNWREYNER